MSSLLPSLKRSSICLLFFASISCTAFGSELIGRVVGVADGDTITVLVDGRESVKVRLAGIDAPEKAQPFGAVSKRHLSDRVFGRAVTVEWTKKDKYGRVVGRVIADGEDVCLDQVRSGLAWHYKRYATEQPANQQTAYASAEAQARQEKFGLWSQPNPVPPWEFRHPERSGSGK
ncbi:MAG: thermonuclease family protein [Fimbriimonadaceae bacterium]|nr:thermonuclease family protein [Fimbriimonadaceae bacterium]